ncbi:hypothetical protein JCM9492_17420 [Aquifex pyrophilus]
MARLFVILFLFVSLSFPFTPQEEKQLIKDVAEIKATLKTFMEQTDKRFTELREDMNKRFEFIDKRFDQLYTFLWIITGIFTTLTASVIAFAGGTEGR